MLRDNQNKIKINRLSKFELLQHDVTEDKVNFEDIWNCIYEHIEVFTDRGTPLIAFRYCAYAYITSFDKSNETNMSKMVLKENHPHFVNLLNKDWNLYSAFQNCLGFCILDNEYWINLTKENLDIIIKDESFQLVDDRFNEDHFLIYYNEDIPIHIARYNSKDAMFEHKIGCNRHLSVNNSDVSAIYTYNKIVRYKRG